MLNLINHFLVASPFANNNLYSKNIVYITDHDENNGAVGVVINRPTSMKLDKVFQNTNIVGCDSELTKTLVFWGGPLCSDNGYLLHKYNQDNDELFELTNSKNVFLDMVNSRDYTDLFVSLGYSGWGELQLEEEISNGTWLVIPAEKSIIFDVDPMDRYEEALHLLGIKNINQLLSCQNNLIANAG